MLPVLEIIVGMTTRALDDAGMPLEKSMRGSALGVTSRVASQLTSETASWLVAITAMTTTRTRRHPTTPSAYATDHSQPPIVAVIAVIVPRYANSGTRLTELRTNSAGVRRYRTARSSSSSPRPMR